MGLIEDLPYIAITVAIDKHAHVEKYSVWHFNPYHYCMRALIERYVLWLNRHKLTGDVVAEPRFKKVDKKLKKSFSYIYDHGTENIPAAIVQARLTSREIKFDPKALLIRPPRSMNSSNWCCRKNNLDRLLRI